MCYMIVLSTDTDFDLTRLSSSLFAFSREMPRVAETVYLTHAHHWYLASSEGCSCSFRHLSGESVTLGFGAPEDWFPEHADHVAATAQVVAAFRSILASGAQLDCIDAWASDDPAPTPLNDTVQVDLGAMPAPHFRFFEQHRLVLTDSSLTSASPLA
ncbi:hypothetical protein [Massilia sp. CF038]|uniref:hypothetical protein n=1 Tax=Massilia sp. CF038 TaxID=1881045 RepID=UPI0009212692|nr:hypothetical protein [Massilia sp. CF038]SHH69638.1 hypothetical protein SAMN05428948_4976 [Massilia sp. CF038]